jgi:superfamily II DNA or RNA helicase
MTDIGAGREARSLLERARRAVDDATVVAAAVEEAERATVPAFEAAVAALVDDHLDALPLERLREVGGAPLRLGALQAAGVRTVGEVRRLGRGGLDDLPDVGPATAQAVLAATADAARAAAAGLRVRLDPERRRPWETTLLRALARLEASLRLAGRWTEPARRLAVDLAPAIDAAAPAGSRLRFALSRRRTKDTTMAAVARVAAMLDSAERAGLVGTLAETRAALDSSALSVDALWADYEQRGADYQAVLGRFTDVALDVAASQGYVPADIAARVEAQGLDESLLRVSLRGYQAFGARFALAQRRVVLGDEMGLGKTVQALAAVAHVHAQGATHSLVVAPASVLVNWSREIARHTALSSITLHGGDRHDDLDAWYAEGGIGVTTFETLRSLPPPVQPSDPTADALRIGVLVVDEAHYVKNPDALRTQATRRWIPVADRVVFLTGTPMENRVEEFRTLVSYLQPDVASTIDPAVGVAGAVAFRRSVAPAYLRRNTDDVLRELPERIEMDDWVRLAPDDEPHYRAAVAAGNFQAMRRAAFAAGPDRSAKLVRLAEILDDAAEAGRKVVVFSMFLGVLDAVHQVAGDAAFGPLTGATPPQERQALVDRFAAADGHAVLVAQIQAGGVGVNIQAASVVVLTEPQWKPSTEEQAIARAHRMGQTRVVHVHRLLAEDTVDEAMREVVAHKAELFDAYARESSLKEASSDAVDATEAAAARRIIEDERARLGIETDRGVTDAARSGEPMDSDEMGAHRGIVGEADGPPR